MRYEYSSTPVVCSIRSVDRTFAVATNARLQCYLANS